MVHSCCLLQPCGSCPQRPLSRNSCTWRCFTVWALSWKSYRCTSLLLLILLCSFFSKESLPLWGSNTWGQCCFMGSMMYGLRAVGASFSPRSSLWSWMLCVGFHIRWQAMIIFHDKEKRHKEQYRSISLQLGGVKVPILYSFPLLFLSDASGR